MSNWDNSNVENREYYNTHVETFIIIKNLIKAAVENCNSEMELIDIV